MSLTVADLVGLRQLIDRYADAVDRRDGDGLLGLFADDGALQVGDDQAWIGPDVVRSLDTLAGYEQTFHHVGGAVFDAEGIKPQPGKDEPGDEPGDSWTRATGRVHCLAHHYQRTESGPVDLVMAVRYLDSYVRIGEPRTQGAAGGTAGSVWRFARREVSIEWTELHAAHPRRRRTGR